jgi:hypothetical protein
MENDSFMAHSPASTAFSGRFRQAICAGLVQSPIFPAISSSPQSRPGFRAALAKSPGRGAKLFARRRLK